MSSEKEELILDFGMGAIEQVNAIDRNAKIHIIRHQISSQSQHFDHELEAFEETKKMKYVTTIERRAEARGLKIGQDQTRSLVQRQLTRRFGELEEAIASQISNLAIEQLESLGEALLDFTTIDDLTHWLDTQPQ